MDLDPAQATLRALVLLPTHAAPVLNRTPFAHRSTPQHAGHRTRAHWPLPPHGTGDPRTALQPREPCQPFGRLAVGSGGMDRLSGAPPLQLGRVRRGARQSGGARTHVRGLAGHEAPQGQAHSTRSLSARTRNGRPMQRQTQPFEKRSTEQRVAIRWCRFLPRPRRVVVARARDTCCPGRPQPRALTTPTQTHTLQRTPRRRTPRTRTSCGSSPWTLLFAASAVPSTPPAIVLRRHRTANEMSVGALQRSGTPRFKRSITMRRVWRGQAVGRATRRGAGLGAVCQWPRE